jgi:hypothetical protein
MSDLYQGSAPPARSHPSLLVLEHEDIKNVSFKDRVRVGLSVAILVSPLTQASLTVQTAY